MSYLNCKDYVRLKKQEIADEISGLKNSPVLCVVQVGDNPASNAYVKGKKNDCSEVGIICKHIRLPNYEFVKIDLDLVLREKNLDEIVNGIIVQLPLPENISEAKVANSIYNYKDVDGFKKDSKFTPCTPKGIIDYLEYNDIQLSGKVCTVIGRSNIVGKPLVNLLINSGATVISCNSKTPDIKKFTKESDMVFSAIGKPNFFDKSYFSKGQILVDVGINRDENGKLCGDICESAKENMLLATPVPCGVGLLTRLALLENVVEAYKIQNSY